MDELGSLFVLGAAYGLTSCGASCLAAVAPVLLGGEGGFRAGARDTAAFAAGKALAYSGIGAASALLGSAFPVPPAAGAALRGVALLAMGATLLWRRPGGCSRRGGGPGGLCAMGIATSLVPCAPLAGLGLLAAREGTLLGGAALGAAFGAGLLAAPVAVLGGALVSGMGQAIRRGAAALAPWLRTASALILIGSGLAALPRAWSPGTAAPGAISSGTASRPPGEALPPRAPAPGATGLARPGGRAPAP